MVVTSGTVTTGFQVTDVGERNSIRGTARANGGTLTNKAIDVDTNFDNANDVRVR
jgi:hypothetical protein